MNGRCLSTYQEPRWTSKITGEARISQDQQGNYFINEVRVVEVHAVDLFSVLTCVDGTTHFVLTAFLRLVHHDETTQELA